MVKGAMRNIFGKLVTREIKGSFSRWLAILAIISLGVGFFSGLKVCKKAFWLTGDTFLSGHNLFDFELISTIGIDKEAIDVIGELDGVEFAEGSVSTDAIVKVDTETSAATLSSKDASLVVKVHQITNSINTLDVCSGRLPENENECVVEHSFFNDAYIGRKLLISEGNDSDTIDKFNVKEFTIVGLVESPIYLNYERGSTSLGGGQVDAFIYLPEESWNCDYFTEIYVSLKDANYAAFSDEYNNAVDNYEETITEVFEECSQKRADKIIGEAKEKLDDAQKEVDSASQELEDGKKELASKEKELKDAEKEISDGKKEIAKAKREIPDGWKQIEEGKLQLIEAEEKAAAAELEINAHKKELETAEAELNASKKILEDNQEQYDQYSSFMTPDEKQRYETELALGWEQYNTGYDQLVNAKKEIEAAEIEIATGKSELAGQRVLLETKEKELIDAEKNLPSMEEELNKAERELEKGRTKLEKAKTELRDGEKELEDGKKELEDARIELEKIDDPKSYILTRSDNMGYMCFENDTSIVDGIAKVFPLFFFLVAALVVMTTMTRMVDEQRTQIGVLKALGYSYRRIMWKYGFYSGSASVLGGIIGFIGGSYLFPWVIWTAYGMMYGFSDLIFVVDWGIGIPSIAAAFICAEGTTLLSLRSDLSEVPAELIRPKSPKAGKRIFLEKIGFIWKRMPFLHKVSARNIFRYKKRFLMMVLGISGCTALLITGFGIYNSITKVADEQYEEIFKVDYTVTFDDQLSVNEKDEFVSRNKDVIGDELFIYTISADMKNNGQSKLVNLVVLDEESISDGSWRNFIGMHTDDKAEIDYPGKGECVLNSNLCSRLGLAVGDEVRLYDSDMNEITAVISAECENYIYNYMYISAETFSEKTGREFRPNSAYILAPRDENGIVTADVNADGAILSKDDAVATVSVTETFRNVVAKMMNAMDYVIYVIIASAGALAFIVLYNLTNINITERIREIATIKVLGFTRKETSQYVFRENVVLTAISSVVGLPLGHLLHSFVMSKILIDMISFNTNLKESSYIMAVIMTFVFAVLVNFVLYFKLEKINMAESMKSVE